MTISDETEQRILDKATYVEEAVVVLTRYYLLVVYAPVPTMQGVGAEVTHAVSMTPGDVEARCEGCERLTGECFMWIGVQHYRVSRQGSQEPLIEVLRRTLKEYPISFALVFGSQVTADQPTTDSDIDVAVEFAEYRPGDEGYNDLYFDVLRALEDTVSVDVDLIDVWTMSPQFAHVVFDDGERLLGTDERQASLEAELAGDPPTFEEARKRVATAATRLRENRS